MKRHLLLAILSLALLGSSTTVAHADLRIRTAEVLPMEGDPTEPDRALPTRPSPVVEPSSPHESHEPRTISFAHWFWRYLRLAFGSGL